MWAKSAKMSRLIVQLAIVISVIVFFSGQGSANFWRQPALPSDPNDVYYQKFQKVPSHDETAVKLMKNFLKIGRPNGFVGRRRRSRPMNEDIVIVMDASQSIGICEFVEGKKALKYMMELAELSPENVSYAAVTYSTSATVDFAFLPFSSASGRIEELSYSGGYTFTDAGLAEAKKLFDDGNLGRRRNSRKMVFLVTDGQSTEEQKTLVKATEVKNDGIQIFVVAVGKYIVGIQEMVKVASHPPASFLFRVESYGGLYKVIQLVYQKSGTSYNISNYDPPCS